MMNAKADNKNLKLNLFVSSSVPEKVFADSYRLGQVLINLIGNSIKFTKSGSLAVDVKTENTNLIFNVSDTGIGIPNEELPYIFETFRQVDSSASRSYGGVGLGLSISKGLVELMGGTIRVESIVGEGSQFTFSIPLKVGN
ncbi:MAG: hypothetical protein C0614_01265 [Desulfuromonas sp.]|nr:MAG: hypothetical protein C0614_01265 [Desulfuromonas sp.]